ncbi:Cmc2p PWA37_004330 [Arxiozyma heterogenica]|uniref:Cmc2p n=1 Tax=Arxiozyma heterogenica TaxID=278026 RepID=UPI002F1DD96F
MHPQLESERFISCHEFIEALNKCHQKQFYKRMFGVCNNEKDALTECLKRASFEAKKHAIIKNKEKRGILESKWKQFDNDEEDKILKIILERQLAKKDKSTFASDNSTPNQS